MISQNTLQKHNFPSSESEAEKWVWVLRASFKTTPSTSLILKHISGPTQKDRRSNLNKEDSSHVIWGI